MEAQLRTRIERLISISKHPIRSIEHKTFRRLLYRNRNQHRHGFYFRKLDHVRRLLSQIDRHIAWESVQYSLGDTGKKGSQTKANLPLSLSSLTVDDLSSVESLLDKLVNTVIIEAARRVVTDLVSREHFLPFAVSVLATLARLFVLERKVLSEVRGVSMELNLLFATDAPSTTCKKSNTPLHSQEDIGLEVSAPIQLKPKLQQEIQLPDGAATSINRSRDGKAAVNETESEIPPGASLIRSGSAGPKAQEPSLYHMVAKHVGTTKFTAEMRERISVSLPDVLSTHQRLEGPSMPNSGKEAGIREATQTDRSTVPVPLQTRRDHKVDSRANVDTPQQRSSEGTDNNLMTISPARASDSDDIDDIFDALEDS